MAFPSEDFEALDASSALAEAAAVAPFEASIVCSATYRICRDSNTNDGVGGFENIKTSILISLNRCAYFIIILFHGVGLQSRSDRLFVSWLLACVALS